MAIPKLHFTSRDVAAKRDNRVLVLTAFLWMLAVLGIVVGEIESAWMGGDVWWIDAGPEEIEGGRRRGDNSDLPNRA